MSPAAGRNLDPGTAVSVRRHGAAIPAAGPVLRRRSSPRLSILHLITRLDRGGSSDCTLLQAIGSARRGHRVTLACGASVSPSPLLREARLQDGLRIVEIP